MAYDNMSYEIKERLPEWWKEDRFLEPINRYSQELIRDLIGGLLSNFGVVQPFQVWKTLPTEYSWTHTYQSHETLLRTPQGGTSPLFLNANKPLYAFMPNSKRNCHGVIQLQLQGDFQGLERPLKRLEIKNANQSIVIKDITTITDIKIFTEDGSILIDGVERDDLVAGRFDKIYPQAQNTNYNEVDIDDENKTTFLSIESSTSVNFALKTKLIHPVYVTEQNIRIHTVSAFPIEWVKLYGFYCHEFNNKQEWRFLWEKNYKEEERVVYDRITKQFDCETFYIQVKLYGIGAPYTYGFPQEDLASNAAFQINRNLDKWGKIYSLPRRSYKTRISEDEEFYTYPQFYNYDIEQDYWYEERLVNEYRHNDDAINSTIIKDSDLNDIALLQCISPSINDIFVYTETIKSSIDNHRQTNEISPTSISEGGDGVEWENRNAILTPDTTSTEILLKPQGSETFNLKENQSKTLEIKFNNIPELPKNIKIRGIELILDGLTDIHSDSLILDDRSQMLLQTTYEKANGDKIKKIDNIQINNETQYWEKGKKIYKIGGPKDLFNLSEIKREQIQNGVQFNLGFTNLNTFLKATIVLYSIHLVIYYEQIYDTYEMDVQLDSGYIALDSDKQYIKMLIPFKNTGEIPVINKNVYISHSMGIDVSKTRFPTFDLDVDENFVIGGNEDDEILITPKKYQYLQTKKNSVISKQINIKDIETISFYYKMNNKATLDIYVGNKKIDSITDNTSSWSKYSYRIKKCDRIQNTDDCENTSGWGDIVSLKINVVEAENNVFFKNPNEWTYTSPSTIVEQVKTGFYDIIVFCDDKSIKNTILIKQTEEL